MEKITKSSYDIYNDAPGVALDYYRRIKDGLTDSEGKEFVSGHPEVVAELARAAVSYYSEERKTKAILEAGSADEDR